jgi:plasmid stabilization system protein ParE
VEAPYIIIYMVDEPADEITVLAIVHGARDRDG